MPGKIEVEKVIFDRGMNFFKWQLGQAGIIYNDAYPYFFSKFDNPNYAETGACTDKLPLKNWQEGGTSTFTYSAGVCNSAVATVGTAGTGNKRMGVALNYKLLAAEKGAHVHNRTYSRQLIFDSIQYLQTGSNSIPAGDAEPNNVISFSNYSAAITPVGGGAPIDGNTTNVTTLKGWLLKLTSGKYYRR